MNDTVTMLRRFKERKSMYVGRVNLDTVQAFLTGVRCAVKVPMSRWWQSQQLRGWKRSCVGPVPQMRKKGLTDEEIMDELTEIEIDAIAAQPSK